MLLFIDTTKNDGFSLALFEPGRKLKLKRSKDFGGLSEKLLFGVLNFLKSAKVPLSKLDKIAVVTGPGNFSRIRTGVATANALGFGLKIPAVGVESSEKYDFEKIAQLKGRIAIPEYGKQPNITKPNLKKPIFKK